MFHTYQHVASPSFYSARLMLRYLMKNSSSPVAVESWQGMKVSGRPDMRTHELLNVTLRVPLYPAQASGMTFSPFDLGHWRDDIKPNLPWADVHFEERVGGIPLNPAPSWKIWPWAASAAKFRRPAQGASAVECEHGHDTCPKCDPEPKFDHTYPERFWPKWAGQLEFYEATVPQMEEHYKNEDAGPNEGIRFRYGDLQDVIDLLRREPHTRQAYLPIFFPEDTSPDAQRKPCTLGYQFIMRLGELHCFYPMRSCDLVRHWADDAYLAVRLVLHVISECASDSHPVWEGVSPGSLTMHMTSLHVFENDMRTL